MQALSRFDHDTLFRRPTEDLGSILKIENPPCLTSRRLSQSFLAPGAKERVVTKVACLIFRSPSMPRSVHDTSYRQEHTNPFNVRFLCLSLGILKVLRDLLRPRMK